MTFKKSDIGVIPRGQNANTRFFGDPVPSLGKAQLQAAYVLAQGVARAMPPMTDRGYRLFCIAGSSFGCTEIPANDGVYKVIGRHARCDVVLQDPEIALRHMVMRAVTMPDGRVALRMLDLDTSLGFHIEDDVPVRSMFARGPVALRVGRYALVAFPSTEMVLPAALPPPVVEHAEGSPYRSPSPRALSMSHLTIFPRAGTLSDVMLPSKGFARVTLRRGRHQHTLDLPDAELDKGMLIGRAEKCNRQLTALLGGSISRVHLLLLRERAGTFAFDLASMHGTFVRGERVRRVELSDRGTTLALGQHEVEIEWRRPPI